MLGFPYSPTLTSIHDDWKNHIALTRWTFVGKVMSPLFNMLSKLAISFLPRSKHLLISRLQSPSAVILEPRKIKSLTENKVSPAESHQLQILHPRRCVQRSAFVVCAIKTVFYPVEDSLRERWREIICILHKFLWLDIDYKAVKSIRKQGLFFLSTENLYLLRRTTGHKPLMIRISPWGLN